MDKHATDYRNLIISLFTVIYILCTDIIAHVRSNNIIPDILFLDFFIRMQELKTARFNKVTEVKCLMYIEYKLQYKIKFVCFVRKKNIHINKSCAQFCCQNIL